MVQITISDTGTPYNPLEKPDPDLGMEIKDQKTPALFAGCIYGIIQSSKAWETDAYGGR